MNEEDQNVLRGIGRGKGGEGRGRGGRGRGAGRGRVSKKGKEAQEVVGKEEEVLAKPAARGTKRKVNKKENKINNKLKNLGLENIVAQSAKKVKLTKQKPGPKSEEFVTEDNIIDLTEDADPEVIMEETESNLIYSQAQKKAVNSLNKIKISFSDLQNFNTETQKAKKVEKNNEKEENFSKELEQIAEESVNNSTQENSSTPENASTQEQLFNDFGFSNSPLTPQQESSEEEEEGEKEDEEQDQEQNEEEEEEGNLNSFEQYVKPKDDLKGKGKEKEKDVNSVKKNLIKVKFVLFIFYFF